MLGKFITLMATAILLGSTALAAAQTADPYGPSPGYSYTAPGFRIFPPPGPDPYARPYGARPYGAAPRYYDYAPGYSGNWDENWWKWRQW